MPTFNQQILSRCVKINRIYESYKKGYAFKSFKLILNTYLQFQTSNIKGSYTPFFNPQEK